MSVPISFKHPIATLSTLSPETSKMPIMAGNGDVVDIHPDGDVLLLCGDGDHSYVILGLARSDGE